MNDAGISENVVCLSVSPEQIMIQLLPYLCVLELPRTLHAHQLFPTATIPTHHNGFLTAQYRVAPFGAIRPYVGGGLNGTYMYARSKAIKVNSGFGPVLQVGVDLYKPKGISSANLLGYQPQWLPRLCVGMRDMLPPRCVCAPIRALPNDLTSPPSEACAGLSPP